MAQFCVNCTVWCLHVCFIPLWLAQYLHICYLHQIGAAFPYCAFILLVRTASKWQFNPLSWEIDGKSAVIMVLEQLFHLLPAEIS